MKKNQIITLVVVAAFVGLLFFINRHEPGRMSEEQAKAAAEAQKLLDQAETDKELTLKDAIRKQGAGVAQAAEAKERELELAKAEAAAAKGPYQVEFQCSNGTFVLEIHPEWAPLAAAQFRTIIESGIYNEARFFRVVPGFVVQWGIPGDPEKAAEWEKRNIADELVKTPNARGTIVYAMLGGQKDTRTSQVYINLVDNAQRLDHLGFAPFGKVVKGMEVVEAINAEYGQEPDQDDITTRGNAYLKEYFPKLDYIKEAKILGDVVAPSAASPQEAAAEAAEPVTTQN
jgi:peptidyl-prolyl cis-trans isomerase A (cyclophilin A)